MCNERIVEIAVCLPDVMEGAHAQPIYNEDGNANHYGNECDATHHGTDNDLHLPSGEKN